ncbi:MAG: phosphoglycerate kinase [Bacilli bacterium]|nr:phosphoglycerate kinase [Bacilli bacterium]
MKRTIRDFKLENKKVIVRCDFNVPIENGAITDDSKIKAHLETIKYIIDRNGKVILLSHLGRIESEGDKQKYSLKPIAIRLSELLDRDVKFVPETKGDLVYEAVANMRNGEIIMLENTRFEDLDGKKESKNNIELSKYWASLGNIFINDAFGTSHRAHASNVGIASNLESGIGFLIEKELNNLEPIIKNPKRPFMVILGGKKVSDKIGVINNLVTVADKIIVGGAMCFTFLKAKGYNVGQSLVEDEQIDFCKKVLELHSDKIILPQDINVSLEYSPTVTGRIVDIANINYNEMGLDIGPQTINLYKSILRNAKTVIWNGPMGVCEFNKFNIGTKSLCEALSKQKITVVIGGGDSAAFVKQFGYQDKFTHVSTGGGATLELLEGKALPGIAVIPEK